MIIILFGLSGVGKNFIGEVIAQEYKFHFWDADNALPSEMRKYISEQKIFTQEMRDKFVSEIIKSIKQLQKKHKDIVISQGLYKERNREQIHQVFPNAQFLWVKADMQIMAERFNTKSGMLDIDYANKISVNFEEPLLAHRVLLNNSNKEGLLEQLRLIINKKS